MILNQWQQWQCKWYSFLGAIMHMNPSIDYEKIIEELKKTNNLLTNQKASKWFIEKWYIKGIYNLRTYQIPIVLKRWIPVVWWLANTKWNNEPPYIIEEDNDWSHSIFLPQQNSSDLFTIQNSWWENWWDNGMCYIRKEDLKRIQSPCYLII